MKQKHLPNLLRTAITLLLCSVAFAADRIELTDGSVIVGKLVSAEEGKIKFETSFAGTIEVAQKEVKTFSTDQAVNVQLAGGSSVLGKVAQSEAGIVVVSNDGQFSAETAKVAAVWQAGKDSPEVRRLKEAADKQKRQWAFEASLAINGRTGGSEKFGGALGFKATLESAQDKLIFNLAAEKAEDNGIETANRQFAGVDYSAFFSEKNVWYARTSIEKDVIKALDLRSTTAFGIGRKLIKKDHQDLEARFGVSYVYETYANGTSFDSPGLDVGLLHTYTFKNGKLNNLINYTPAFENFANYRVHHESSFEMPITASRWKLKIGVTNDYTSEAQPGIDNLDTIYFTSLILNWN